MKTISLIALGLALVGTATWAMSDTHAIATTAAAHQAGTILPYGAVNHDVRAAVATILPYGAISAGTATPAEAVTPYGTIGHHTGAGTSEAILPYGAMGPHAAP
ncbi:MAG TPA: hypothetical protein VGN46_00610 [Luteibacter sp.]|jgi:hypothetical protein|uniref:hypothetical protein n=1 Tax=Luteibacter sp. TaxID=1886636 RepID=UPI002F4241ED